MGNSISGSVEEQSDLASIYHSVEGFHVEDDHLIVTSASGDHRVNYDVLQHTHSELFGCSAKGLALQAQSQRGDATPRSAMRLGRGNDSTARGDVDMSDVLSILEQIKKSASPDELIALQKALMPSSNDIIIPDAKASVTKRKPTKAEALLRRRSFATPGIATRESPPQKQLASPQALKKSQTWNTDMFGQSPLSKLAGWESKNNGLSERALTPDINHLGGHELGSLRVTNGAVSPDPSIRRELVKEPSVASMKREDDYFTASEGSGRDSPTKFSQHSAQSPGASATITDGQVTPRRGGSPYEEPWAGVQEFQPHHEDISPSTDSRPSTQGSSDSEFSYFRSAGVLLDRSGSVLRPYHHEVSSNPFLASSSDDERTSEEVQDQDNPQVTARTPSAALYQTEANSNPFLPLNGDRSLAQDASSRLKDAHDEDQAVHVRYHRQAEGNDSPRVLPAFSGVRPWSYRPDACEKLFGTNRIYGEPQSSTSSIYTVGSKREKREPIGRSNLDSGYQSESSLRNLDETNVEGEASKMSAASSRNPHTVVNDALRGNDAKGHGSLYRVKDTSKPLPPGPPSYVQTTADAPAPNAPGSTPRHRMPTKTQSSGAIPLMTGLESPAPANSSPSSTKTNVKHKSITPISPVLQRVVSSPLLSLGNDSAKPSKGPKKLQKKRRPLSDRLNSEPVIVQSQMQVQPNGTGFPQIPNDVSSRYVQRMSREPDMEFLKRTFKSVSHSNSHDSLSSFQPFDVQNIRFPSPSRSPERNQDSDRGNFRRRQSFGAELSMRNLFRSKSRGRGERTSSDDRSNEHQQHCSVTDFGTVTRSLGSSPYDLASSAREGGPRPRSMHGPRQLTHPHQISSNVPRAKSVVGMSDMVASAFAMQRSRDVVEGFGDIAAERQTHEAAYDPHEAAYDHREAPAQAQFRARPNQLSNPSSNHPSQDPTHTPSAAKYRRKSVHGSVAADMEEDKALHSRSPNSQPEGRNIRVKNHAEPCDNDEHSTKSSATEDGWEHFAKTWRRHRKSVGENLHRAEHARDHPQEWVQDQSRPQPTYARSAPQTPVKPRQPPSWQGGDNSGRDYQHARKGHGDMTASAHSRLRQEAPPLRTSSPTPSVLERAAAFEGGIVSQPTSRRQQYSPSKPYEPAKHSTPGGPGPGLRDSHPANSPYYAPASGPARPSGVASAYTQSPQPTSHRATHSKSSSGPPKLYAPRKRPWPTAAHPSATPIYPSLISQS